MMKSMYWNAESAVAFLHRSVKNELGLSAHALEPSRLLQPALIKELNPKARSPKISVSETEHETSLSLTEYACRGSAFQKTTIGRNKSYNSACKAKDGDQCIHNTHDQALQHLNPNRSNANKAGQQSYAPSECGVTKYCGRSRAIHLLFEKCHGESKYNRCEYDLEGANSHEGNT